jgi:hypothetical protein
MMRHDQPAEPTAPSERVTGPHDDSLDPLAAFPSEAEVAATVVLPARRRRRTTTRLLLVCAAAAAVAVAAWPLVPGVWDGLRGAISTAAPPAVPAAGTLVIETTPPGWEVVETGRSLGTTPFRGSLSPGRHALVLRSGGESRPLDVVLTSGAQVFHHLDLQVAPSTGVLSIATLPPGAAVEIDGVDRGVSPVDVSGLAPGDHAVSVVAGNRTVTQQVTVAAGRTTTLLVPVARPDPPPGTVGFVTVAAPIELQVFDGDSLVGSSRNERIMVVPGRRSLRLTNPALGFERVVDVAVAAGAVSKVTVPVPNGSLSVNAQPWAEVVLDGKVIGETPIANFAVLPGTHEILLRNPKFPEYRRTVVVTLAVPLRLGVDLRQ